MNDFETVPVGTLAERDAAVEQVVYWRERALAAEAEVAGRAR